MLKEILLGMRFVFLGTAMNEMACFDNFHSSEFGLFMKDNHQILF